MTGKCDIVQVVTSGPAVKDGRAGVSAGGHVGNEGRSFSSLWLLGLNAAKVGRDDRVSQRLVLRNDLVFPF